MPGDEDSIVMVLAVVLILVLVYVLYMRKPDGGYWKSPLPKVIEGRSRSFRNPGAPFDMFSSPTEEFTEASVYRGLHGASN